MSVDKTFSIRSEGTKGTGIMRGRDVREKLAGELHPKVVEVIATLAEVNHTNSLAIAELATMQDKFLDMLQGFTDVAANMKDRTDQMMRATQATADEGTSNDAAG